MRRCGLSTACYSVFLRERGRELFFRFLPRGAGERRTITDTTSSPLIVKINVNVDVHVIKTSSQERGILHVLQFEKKISIFTRIKCTHDPWTWQPSLSRSPDIGTRDLR